MNRGTIAVAIITLSIGLGLGYVLFQDSSAPAATPSSGDRQPLYYRNPMNPTVTSPIPAQDSMGMAYIPVYADEEKPAVRAVLFYRNPMNPAVTSPIPAQDNMGMDYIPVYADGIAQGDVAGTVEIDPVVVQNIGVRTQIAERRALSRTIKTVGRVDFNEEQMARLHPKVEGWIEEIRVDKTGQQVEADDILLSLYAPKLVSAQQEYLLALNNQSVLDKSSFEQIRNGAKDLTRSARARLELLDVPEHQVLELEASREIKKYIHIHAPWAGTVISIGARAGQFVTPGTELYMMVNLEEVWVYADVYEYELPWVSVGDAVEMTLVSVPGRTFRGTLDYIYPYAESKTRTTKVRLVFDNTDRLLRPDVFADITISSDTQEEAIVIPAEAVVRSGDRTQAFVVREPGKFEPRDIQTGIESQGFVTVLEGIEAGEEVVTSAQFLVDSESKLREATAKMMEVLKRTGRTDAPGAMNHDGHVMDKAPTHAMNHDGHIMEKALPDAMNHDGHTMEKALPDAMNHDDHVMEKAPPDAMNHDGHIMEKAPPDAMNHDGHMMEKAPPHAMNHDDHVMDKAPPDAMNHDDHVMEKALPGAMNHDDHVMDKAPPDAMNHDDHVMEKALPDAMNHDGHIMEKAPPDAMNHDGHIMEKAPPHAMNHDDHVMEKASGAAP